MNFARKDKQQSQRPGEPASFAWTEPLAPREPEQREEASKDGKPRVVLVGRGPSVAERLALVAPHPTTIAAGAAILFVAITGLALISPSGDQATAARSGTPFNSGSVKSDGTISDATRDALKPLSDGDRVDGSSKRDPFAQNEFAEAKSSLDAKQRKTKQAQLAQLKVKRAAERKAREAAKKIPPYTGDFIYYSDYTPWERVAGKPGSWLEFDGQQTLLVQSVSSTGANLFVVSDVEVLGGKGKDYSYSYPLRRLYVKPGAVVRFADYRDVQGEDVTYTLRFRGSIKNPESPQNR